MRKPAAYFAKQEFTFRPAVIEFTDMRVPMQEFAVETAKFSITQYLKGDRKNFFEVAEMIKVAFEEQYGGAFHVVVGRSYGSYFSYEALTCMMFWLNEFSFLIFKHG
jgi:dynein light chain LC8-type